MNTPYSEAQSLINQLRYHGGKTLTLEQTNKIIDLLEALQPPQVDVESLKRTYNPAFGSFVNGCVPEIDVKICDAENRGWNDCLTELASRGLIAHQEFQCCVCGAINNERVTLPSPPDGEK